MGHALAALSRNLIPIIVCFILSACNGSYTAFESDVDFDNDVKTADIRQDNAELITLAAYQSAFLGHSQSAAYLFLDASDLPEDADPTAVNKEYQRTCSNNVGTARYSYSRDPGEAHKVGDKISISYENCGEGDYKYNGSMSATYTKIKGLNDRFTVFTTDQCMAKLQGNLNINELSIDHFTYDSDQDHFTVNNDSTRIVYPEEKIDLSSSRVISVPGDDISFTRVGQYLIADILSNETIEDLNGGSQSVINTDLSFSITNNQNIIFILRSKEPTDSMITSIDGDQFYSVVGLENKKENCQGFERTLSVNFNKFSTDRADYLTTTLNGSVSLLEAQKSPSRVNQSFINSKFTTTVTQGFSTEVYSMDDYSVEKAYDVANNTYSYEFIGLVSNTNIFGGLVALAAPGELFGSFDNLYPSSGLLVIQGKGLERIFLDPNDLKIQLRVDFNGDSVGNGFSDVDIFIASTWEELFAREFKE